MTAHKHTSAGLTPADAPPDDIEALAEEIEQTRESLGETVEALAAKADIKARVQDKVTDVRQTVLASAGQEAGRRRPAARPGPPLLSRFAGPRSEPPAPPGSAGRVSP